MTLFCVADQLGEDAKLVTFLDATDCTRTQAVRAGLRRGHRKGGRGQYVPVYPSTVLYTMEKLINEAAPMVPARFQLWLDLPSLG